MGTSKPIALEEAGRVVVDEEDRLILLKATGVMSKLAKSISGWQAKVEARCTSSPRSTKKRIQLSAIGERPSATNNSRMGALCHILMSEFVILKKINRGDLREW